MNVSEMFKRKTPSRRVRPVGMSQAELEAVDAEFNAFFAPVAEKATEYFRNFTINSQKRSWILPSVEDYTDIPAEKKKWALRYKEWLLCEINKVVLDDVPWL